MDRTKIFGIYPDGFRISYNDLLATLLSGETLCATGGVKYEQPLVLKKLAAEHGGNPKMYYSPDGMYA